MRLDRMWVRVLLGAALLSGTWGRDGIAQGQEKSGHESVDPPEERRQGKEGRRNAIADGTVVGTVKAKEPASVDILSQSGKTARYIPEWVGGMPAKGGGPDKRVVEQIRELGIGDLVAVKWYVDDHLRILKIEILERAAERREEAEQRNDGGGEGEDHGELDGLPAAVVGFSGMVQGVVTKKRERQFDLKINSVLKVWRGNQAEAPQKLAGMTVKIGPAWRKNAQGKWQPLEAHAKFIGTLVPEQKLTIEIRHAERDAFAILELSEEQRRRAAGGGEELQTGFAGFYGMVRGEVTEKNGEQDAIVLAVAEVAAVWKENHAREPKALVGKTVRVRIKKGYHRESAQRALFRLLQPGEKIAMEVRHCEGEVFEIVELTEEQRRRVDKPERSEKPRQDEPEKPHVQ